MMGKKSNPHRSRPGHSGGSRVPVRVPAHRNSGPGLTKGILMMPYRWPPPIGLPGSPTSQRAFAALAAQINNSFEEPFSTPCPNHVVLMQPPRPRASLPGQRISKFLSWTNHSPPLLLANEWTRCGHMTQGGPSSPHPLCPQPWV